jgi:hypothetical protein
MGKKSTYLMIAVLCAIALFILVVRWHGNGIRCIHLKPLSTDNSDWVYFPVAHVGDELIVADSYMQQVDGHAYNQVQISPTEPRRLNVKWCFRRVPSAKKYGLVLRIRQIAKSIDNTNTRVLWLSPLELADAVRSGELSLPSINSLPEFDMKALNLH